MSKSHEISGRIVDVVQRKMFYGTVSVVNGKIAEIIETATGADQYIIPGLIDAHVHIESSMLIPSNFACAAVVHGTVAAISDSHEIANVMGLQGVKFMIENGKKTPVKFYFGDPSCVPATSFETSGATINSEDIKELMKNPDIYYLAEMINFPGVLLKDADVFDVLSEATKTPKEHYNLDIGLLQKGDSADMVIVDNLKNFNVKKTFINGELVYDEGKVLINKITETAINNFNCLPVSVSDIVVTAKGEKIQVMVAKDGDLFTGKGISLAKTENGNVVCAIERDILKIVINKVIDCKGGIAICDSDVVKSLKLDVARVMSTEEAGVVAHKYRELDAMAKEMGSKLTAPFMIMAFMALLVIPELKISDKGLFDVSKFNFTTLFVE